jgi:exonuclease VII large subunit
MRAAACGLRGGHETDFTIADFVADLRAPTPSAAAELITEAQHKIAEHLATQSHRLERAARFQLLQARQRLTHVPSEPRRIARDHAVAPPRHSGSMTRLERLDTAVAAQLRGAAESHDRGAGRGGPAPRPAAELARAREQLARPAAPAWTAALERRCSLRLRV